MEKGVGTVLIGNHALAPFKKRMFFVEGEYFFLTGCPLMGDPHDIEKVKALLDKWYSYHAKMVFHKRLLVCDEMAKVLRVPLPNMMLRKMKMRWGSCSSRGAIVLNTALVKASLYCIDYVIIHELCHLKVRHHTTEFWRLLRKLMPDWEERKERLERMLV